MMSVYRNDEFTSLLAMAGIIDGTQLSNIETSTVVQIINILDQELQARASDEASKHV